MNLDANGNSEVILNLNNAEMLNGVDLLFRNVRMPFVQHRIDKAYEIPLTFKDKNGITQVKITTFIRATLAGEFGSGTVLTRSDEG
mmetsp:Transcript_9181/g.6940  ORF Transcript_9181/g.6940 Transcript_9181/m.6940 type:complete len:86 (-) Transcript_9181:196-453(-)